MAMVVCAECRNNVSDRAKTCPSCGVPINGTKSRPLAIVAALFLGGIGIHKFYLNKPGQGFLYILFCWTFVPAVIALVEALNFLFMSNSTFQAKYG